MSAEVVEGIAGRVVGQPRMLALLRAANAGKRTDSRRTWDAVAKALVDHADWRTGAITAPHEAIAAAAGAVIGRAAFSHDTVARVVAAAEAAGVLVCPEGLGGRSKRALGGRRNQCPTYFVVDPQAAAASADADLRTPPSHDSETVAVVGTKALYKGPIFPKFANFDPSAVPATKAERRAAGEWLRSELHIGAVPNWLVTAMMSQHFAAGLSPRQVFRRVCAGPDGAAHRSLPVGEQERADAVARSPRGSLAGMLLGIIGYRLRLWRDVAPPQPAAPRPAPSATLPAPRTSPSGAALADLARLGLRAGALR